MSAPSLKKIPTSQVRLGMHLHAMEGGKGIIAGGLVSPAANSSKPASRRAG